MKEIEVRDQVRLPLRRCFRICVQGIRYRLFRSSVTVVIVSLAVSFLMMMLSTSTVDRQVTRDLRARTAPDTLLKEWVQKLALPMASEALAERLAAPAVKPGSTAWAELRDWGKLTDEQLAQAKAAAQRQVEFWRFLARILPGERSALVGSREGDNAVALLKDNNALNLFVRNVRDVQTSFARNRDWLEELVEQFEQTRPLRERIISGHAAAVASVAPALKEISVLGRLAGSEQVVALVREHGFVLDRADYRLLKRQAQLELDAQQLLALLDSRLMRGAIADRARVEVRDLVLGHLYKVSASTKGGRWLKDKVLATRRGTLAKIEQYNQDSAWLTELATWPAQRVSALASAGLTKGGPPATPTAPPAGDPRQLARLIDYDHVRRSLAERTDMRMAKLRPTDLLRTVAQADGGSWLQGLIQVTKEEIQDRIRQSREMMPQPLTLSAERIAHVASHKRQMSRLAEIISTLPEQQEGGWLGFSRRTGWLIIISFMVCVVGVANAMLMSVTERFREIATMKCLGAMDSFIMINFVLESSILGLAGGMIGAVLGLLLGVLKSVWGFGTLAFANLPTSMLSASAGLCLAAGVALAALAAVYPAWVAARLAPMEAMRIE